MAVGEHEDNFGTHRLSASLWAERRVAAWCELFHPVRSQYIDPIFGDYRGRSEIQTWLTRVMMHAGDWKSRTIGNQTFDGVIAAGEAELIVPLRSGEFILPFAWVQRYESGWIVYRRDYYDTHEVRRQVPPEALKRSSPL